MPFDSDTPDPNDPRVIAFRASQAKLEAAQNARSVADWINLLESTSNPSAGEQQLLAALRQNPNAYEVGRQGKPGMLRKKSKLDFIGNHPWLTTGAFLAGAAAPALLGGGAGASAGTTGGSALLPSSSLPVSALMGGPGAIASQGVSAGIPLSSGATSMGLGGAAKKIGKGALDFFGGGKDGGGFGIDDLIKLIVAGKGVKDIFGLGDDEEAEWATFENESRGGRSLDPRDILSQGLGQAEGALADAQTRAKTPIRLRSSFVQQPPQFYGGGLPMGIGLSGMDPALKDPSLLKSDSPDASDEEAFAALEMLRG